MDELKAAIEHLQHLEDNRFNLVDPQAEIDKALMQIVKLQAVLFAELHGARELVNVRLAALEAHPAVSIPQLAVAENYTRPAADPVTAQPVKESPPAEPDAPSTSSSSGDNEASGGAGASPGEPSPV